MTKLTANNVKFTRSVGTTSVQPTFIPYSTAELIRTIQNPNSFSTANNDYFGQGGGAISIDPVTGGYFAVGTPFEDDALRSDQGVVYIFETSTGNLVNTIVNPNYTYPNLIGDYFGRDIKMYGNYLAAASVQDNNRHGVVSIYHTTSGDWTDAALLHTLVTPVTESPGSTTEQFGYSVDMNGTNVIIGSPYNDEPGSNQGKAYVFDVVNGNLLQSFSNPNAYSTTTTSDLFGWAVSIYGDVAVVGAHNEDDPTMVNAGKAYVYSVSTGSLLYTLDNPHSYSSVDIGVSGDQFGNQVVVNDNYIVISSNFADTTGGLDKGDIHVYDLNGSLLNYIPSPVIGGDGKTFGQEIKLFGRYIAVGTPNERYNGTGLQTGLVHIFDADTGNLLISIDSPYFANGAAFGHSLDIRDNTLLVGAYGVDTPATNSGVVYLYQLL